MAEGRLHLLREQPRLNPIASAESGLEILPSGIWARIILRKKGCQALFSQFEKESFSLSGLKDSPYCCLQIPYPPRSTDRSVGFFPIFISAGFAGTHRTVRRAPHWRAGGRLQRRISSAVSLPVT
jgi:hypothetical protein